MTRTIALTILFAVTLLPLSACDTVKAPAGVRQDPLHSTAYPQIVILGGLSEWIAGDRPIIEPATPDKPMKVTVPIRSQADAGLNVQYQFTWFDAQGRPIGQPGGQRFVNIAPRTQVFLEGSPLETTAVDWRLEIRPGR
jgi:uncharacterized protein YcfL